MKHLPLILAAWLMLAAPAWANRLCTSGYETNNFQQTEWNFSSGAGLSIQTATVHSGTYAARINQTTAVAYARCAFPSKTTGSVFAREFKYFTTPPNAGASLIAISSGGAENSVRYVISGTTWQITSVGGGTSTGTTVLNAGEWYRFELRVLLSDTVGEVEGNLYSDMSTTPLETLNLTNQDTIPTNIQQVYFGSFGATNTTDLYMDDIAVNNEAGTFQTSWPGPGKIALTKPASDDTVLWTKTGANCSATTNTDCVDDVPGTPDDVSGYNMSATANQEDRLNTTTLPAEVPSDADMILLDVYDRWDGNGSTGTRTGRHLIWDEASAQTNGPTHARCDGEAGNWSIANSAQHSVFDLGTRTKANVESFDLGYEPINSAECRVTALWGNVEWKAAAVVTGMKRRAIVFD